MEYINSNRETFNNTEIQFGTLQDYFNEVHARQKLVNHHDVATITGDFFPYADVYADAKPSYWTGYYTTRKYLVSGNCCAHGCTTIFRAILEEFSA